MLIPTTKLLTIFKGLKAYSNKGLLTIPVLDNHRTVVQLDSPLSESVKFDKTGKVIPLDHSLDFEPLSLSNPVEQLLLPREYFEFILPYISKDSSRYILNFLEINERETVATDGHILKTIDVNSKESLLIHRKTIALLLKLMKASKNKKVVLSYDSGNILFVAESFRMQVNRVQSEFPRYANILPKKYKDTLRDLNFHAIDDAFKAGVEKDKKVYISIIDGVIYLSNNYTRVVIGTSESQKLSPLYFNLDYIKTCVGKSKSVTLKYNDYLTPCELNGSIIMPMKEN